MLTKIENRKSKIENLLPLLLILLAFGLRVWRLDRTPPGWRDDELINSLVISQKVLDGNFAAYFPDASGHEALYHSLNALMLDLFGPNFLGIRYLSALLSVITIALTFLLGRSLFNRRVGLIAAAALTVSFWSLMYARIGLRHVLTPPLAILAFYFFWQALGGSQSPNLPISISEASQSPKSYWRNYLLSALFTALGLYTYFASRGVPLILLAYGGSLAIFVRGMFKRHWQGWLLWLGATAVLSLPLILTLQQQPGSEARVAELALPLIEARAGNFQPLWQYSRTTLAMFRTTGDNEWLYNIPDRPIFGPLSGFVFWLGVILALKLTINNWQSTINNSSSHPSPHFFLLLWWLAGISPAFISIPPASLSHTILAQPATYLLLALPLGARWWKKTILRPSPLAYRLWPLVLLFFFINFAIRDLPDYFASWPQRGQVRFLYRADYAKIADYLNRHEELTDFGITSLLAGPWDKVALDIDADRTVRPRWYNPERVLLVQPPLSFYGFPGAHNNFAAHYQPSDIRIGGYHLGSIQPSLDRNEVTCFQNGLCVLTAVYTPNTLSLTWQLQRPLDLPPIPLISNPPPSGVYAGPRLAVFAQILGADDQFLTGDDGLWLDPTTLHEGDIFIQQHHLPSPHDGQIIVFGLYDPMTNERILTEDGRHSIAVELGD